MINGVRTGADPVRMLFFYVEYAKIYQTKKLRFGDSKNREMPERPRKERSSCTLARNAVRV